MTTPSNPKAPNPLDFTPKQYHKAFLRYMSLRNEITLAEVREYYDNDVAKQERNQEWVNAVFLAAKTGQELTRKILDKLEDVRPGAALSLMHDNPEANVPFGYQVPSARKLESDKKFLTV